MVNICLMNLIDYVSHLASLSIPRSSYFSGESAGIMKRFADATYVSLLRRIFENGAGDLLSFDAD